MSQNRTGGGEISFRKIEAGHYVCLWFTTGGRGRIHYHDIRKEDRHWVLRTSSWENRPANERNFPRLAVKNYFHTLRDLREAL